MMKKSVKTILFAALSVVFVYGMMLLPACSGGGGGSSSSSSGTTTTYSGTLYMASEAGGHFGVFPVTIDPTAATPITVDASAVKKIQIKGAPGSGTAVVNHDVRFGVNADGTTNYNRIYYAAIMSEASNTAVADIGYVDLTQANAAATNNAINSTIDIDAAGADTIAFALSQIAPVEFGASGARILYCASGMNKDFYFPMSMSFPPYVDAVPVSAIETAGSHVTSSTTGFLRTGLGQIDDSMNLALWTGVTVTITTENGTVLPLNALGVPPLAFIHGASSPDGTKIYMSTNQMAGLTHTQNTAGFIRAYLVNASDLTTESSTTPGMSRMTSDKVLSSGTYTVSPSNSDLNSQGMLAGTIAYRATFTPDDKYILQSGSDRMLILNVSDLSEYVDTAGTTTTTNSVSNPGQITSGLGAGTWGGIEVHDVISTPDSKYAILSVRYYADQTQAEANGAGHPGIKTSGVQLYDINNKAFVGNVVSTCGGSGGNFTLACHPATSDFMSRPTCGVLFKSN
jgi:hypothetical protein